MALNATTNIYFFYFAKSCAQSSLSNIDNVKKKLTVPFKAIIRGVFSKSYCCYGILLCYGEDNNMFTNGWAVF